jgi:hypothetical protein
MPLLKPHPHSKLFTFAVRGMILFVLTFALMVPSSDAAKAKTKEKPIKVKSFPMKGIWLNSKPLTLRAFDDKLTLVYFWDYTSVNSLREINLLKKWSDLYRPYGLQMIWIHAAEFEFAQRADHVRQAVKRFKIPFPVFLDNEYKVWDSYKVHSWPTKFLVYKNRVIVFSQVGEGGYLQMENQIRAFLKRLNPSAVFPKPLFEEDIQNYNTRRCGHMSSETYTGYKRSNWWGARIANRNWVPNEKVVMFKDYGERPDKGFFVHGLWANREDSFEHARQTDQFEDYLGLEYLAHEAYAVIHRADGSEVSRIYVTRDGDPVPVDRRGVDLREDSKGNTYFLLQDPRMYYLIANEDKRPHELKLLIRAAGVAVHSFSFSNKCLTEFEHV